MGAAFAHGLEPPLRGGSPPQRVTMGPVQKSQSTSGCEVLGCWAAPQPCRLHTPLSAETTWWYCTAKCIKRSKVIQKLSGTHGGNYLNTYAMAAVSAKREESAGYVSLTRMRLDSLNYEFLIRGSLVLGWKPGRARADSKSVPGSLAGAVSMG